MLHQIIFTFNRMSNIFIFCWLFFSVLLCIYILPNVPYLILLLYISVYLCLNLLFLLLIFSLFSFYLVNHFSVDNLRSKEVGISRVFDNFQLWVLKILSSIRNFIEILAPSQNLYQLHRH
jgi:hypothetical protein